MIDDGRWIYSSNQEVVQVSGWNPDEPNGHTGENCVAMWHTLHGRWADIECGVALTFICEAEIEYVHLCNLSISKVKYFILHMHLNFISMNLELS